MKRTLFDLTSEALAIQSMLEEMGGEITDDDLGTAIDNLLDDNSRALDEKLDGYVSLIAEYDYQEDVCKREAERYRLRAQGASKRREFLKERLKLFFARLGKDEHATARHTIKLVRNGGPAPVVIDPETDPAQVPEQFRKVKFEFDRDSIRRALTSGETLLFAELGERSISVRIR